MSTDARVTKDLMETLKDGEAGFTKAAEKLETSDDPQLATTFRHGAEQRARFYQELDVLAQQYGDDVDESGSVGGTVHRGWLAVKDALTGSSPDAVLKAATTGEDHAVGEYESALEKDISPELRTVVERQLGEVRATRDTVTALAERS
jgi:uncharacterized protein (TIGR02284 family)